jgi:DnaJ-class molecular chaperone
MSEMIECPCCHGTGELEVRDKKGRILFYACTHCMGAGRVKQDFVESVKGSIPEGDPKRIRIWRDDF